ncbi:MAG: metal ABC transporter permease [Acholeplasmataceae bacterium]
MANLWILLIMIIVSLATSILGVFLVLRKMSMQIDAISHTVLLGIVLSFMIVMDLNSPLLIIGASLMGVLTVFLGELLVKTKKTDEESAIGVIFPLLFSVAVVIVTLYFSGVHLDIDAVLLGKVELSVFDQLVINGVKIGPKSFYIILSVFIINLLFVGVFYKELKLISFDEALAKTLGFMPTLIHYLLMTLISLTAVTSFNIVGSILVISLMIAPPATALLITKDLFKTIMYSLIIGVINSVLGFFTAIVIFKGEVTIAGMVSSFSLISFLMVLIFNSKNGVIYTIYKRYHQKFEFSFIVLMLHIGNHQHLEGEEHEIEELLIPHELKWSLKKYQKLLHHGFEKKLIYRVNGKINLTDQGILFYEDKLKYL